MSRWKEVGYISSKGISVYEGERIPSYMKREFKRIERMQYGEGRDPTFHAWIIKGKTYKYRLKFLSHADPIIEKRKIRSDRGTAIVLKDEKVLLVKDVGHKKWSLPGGDIKTDESYEQAAVRELFEELGMRAKSVVRMSKADFIGSSSFHKVSLIESDDTPRIRDGELADYAWIQRSKLDKVKSYHHVSHIMKTLEAGAI